MITIEYEHLVAFFVALIVAFFSTPIAKRIAVRVGAVDVPKDDRRMHRKPMALMGGLAVIFGFFVSALYSFSTRNFSGFLQLLGTWRVLGPVLATLIIIAMGIIDDIHPLKARTKLPFQVIAAALVASSGTRVIAISKPFADIALGRPEAVLLIGDILSYLVTILWIVGVTNAINLIDGLDGLSAGVSGIAALSLFVVAVIKGEPEIALLSVTVFGGVIGFLPYNFNPAKIFSGSTGAYFLGFMLAVISLAGTMKSVTAISLAIPILVLGLPLFDTLFAMTRRFANGRPIGEGDRGHIHHRLVDMGLSHRMSVIVLYVISGALGLVSITLADKGILMAILLIVFILVFIIGGARNLTEMRQRADDEGDGNGTPQETDSDRTDPGKPGSDRTDPGKPGSDRTEPGRTDTEGTDPAQTALDREPEASQAPVSPQPNGKLSTPPAAADSREEK
jgi:UDP-GlcNAc:undecaprenyl-phosphate GlcNAc-1-phosphate transferase